MRVGWRSDEGRVEGWMRVGWRPIIGLPSALVFLPNNSDSDKVASYQCLGCDPSIMPGGQHWRC